MPLLENRVGFDVRKPLNRTTLGEVLDTLEDALVPIHADLQIIVFPDKDGFAVKASWTKNVA